MNDLNQEELIFKIAFSSLRLPLSAAALMLKRMGEEVDVMKARENSFPADAKLPPSVRSLSHRKELVEEARKELDFINEHGIKPIYFTDFNYPRRLLECDESPLILYGLGESDYNKSRIISIVGTRHATVYGIQCVSDIVKELKQKMVDPFIIVSGLAFGIDIAAHKAALDNNVPTIGVLASGLNTIYPPQHRLTAIKMVEKGGMLLSDYRSIDVIHKGNFLARNRIIAAMCDCLIVGESSVKGGALHTAKLAFDYNRSLFAIPGRVNDTYSLGCNNLISRNKATIFTSVDDLLDEMGWEKRSDVPEQKEIPNLDCSPLEIAILKLLDLNGEMLMDDIREILNLKQNELSSLLIEMEFKGLLTAVPGGRYRTGSRT